MVLSSESLGRPVTPCHMRRRFPRQHPVNGAPQLPQLGIQVIIVRVAGTAAIVRAVEFRL
ncbi:hypothetical protein Z951_23800 [Streptomyces sp. PRh5]|nr:hypothetical protein Z951_23800 [Streptomyces sp. PRh5]